MKYRVYLAITFLFFSSYTFGQTIRINVLDSHEKVKLDSTSLQLYKSNSDSLFYSTLTDYGGEFVFRNNLPKDTYDLHVQRVGFNKKILRNIIVSKDTTITVDLYTPCRYDLSKNDRTCPVCHKQDMAIPIVYGKTDMTKADKDFYPGGCIITRCDPHWYCKRDSAKF